MPFVALAVLVVLRHELELEPPVLGVRVSTNADRERGKPWVNSSNTTSGS